MTKRLLLTGAGGFIGSHTLVHFLASTDWEVVAVDSFRHKGNTDRLHRVLVEHTRPGWRERTTVITHDLCAPISEQTASRIGHIDYVIAMASESHVPRSIADPVGFVKNNVDTALHTLEYCRAYRPEAVIMVSTDEVYGPVTGDRMHPEWDTILPSSPYSASKAAQEALGIAWWRTYGLPVVIVNCMNLVGEMQAVEKYLPTLIRKITAGEEVSVHGAPGNIGTRIYQHPRNLADAMLFLLRNAEFAGWVPGQTAPGRYHVVGSDKLSNLDLAQTVADTLGKPLRYHLVDPTTTRPGHDAHYGLDGSKLAALGWKQPVPFAESLPGIVRWTLEHPEWLLPV